MVKLINRIPGSRLLISSLPGSALRTHVDIARLRLASLAMSTCILKALPGKLDIKRHSPSILYFHIITSLLQVSNNLKSASVFVCIRFSCNERSGFINAPV